MLILLSFSHSSDTSDVILESLIRESISHLFVHIKALDGMRPEVVGSRRESDVHGCISLSICQASESNGQPNFMFWHLYLVQNVMQKVLEGIIASGLGNKYEYAGLAIEQTLLFQLFRILCLQLLNR